MRKPKIKPDALNKPDAAGNTILELTGNVGYNPKERRPDNWIRYASVGYRDEPDKKEKANLTRQEDDHMCERVPGLLVEHE